MITELIPFEETEKEMLLREVEELRISINKCRRKQFAEIGTMKKQIIEIKNEFEDWKASICKGEKDE